MREEKYEVRFGQVFIPLLPNASTPEPMSWHGKKHENCLEHRIFSNSWHFQLCRGHRGIRDTDLCPLPSFLPGGGQGAALNFSFSGLCPTPRLVIAPLDSSARSVCVKITPCCCEAAGSCRDGTGLRLSARAGAKQLQADGECPAVGDALPQHLNSTHRAAHPALHSPGQQGQECFYQREGEAGFGPCSTALPSSRECSSHLRD